MDRDGAITYQPLTREVAVRDGAAIVGLGSTLSWETWTIENLLAERPDKWSLSLIACHANTPIAYAVASRRDQGAHLHHLIVGSEWRGRGIGSELLRRLALKTREMGMTRLTFKVHRSNETALAFYRKHGFDVVGQQEPDLLLMAGGVEGLVGQSLVRDGRARRHSST